MNQRFQRMIGAATISAVAALGAQVARAGDEKALIGSYTLMKRVGKDGKERTGPDVMGFVTFTKTRRTVIMKWNDAEGKPVSIAFIASYTLSGGKYCEAAVYGVQSNLGGPGVSYDPPSGTPSCTAAVSDATGLSFEIPNENLRLSVTRDGFRATTPRWTDHWEKVK
jgi:hypothetical protein